MVLTNIKEFTVSSLAQDLKVKIERDYDHIRVRGEISGAKQAASGHWYLSLKDVDNVLDAVIWRGQASKLQHQPEDGLEIVASGKLTTYGGRSKYQLIIDSIEPYGIGALLKQLAQRKEKLQAEGLFDTIHKKSLPFLPTRIGIITSPTGAVIKDIMHRINERFPRHVIMAPVKVQGDGASDEIINAIHAMQSLNNDKKPDVIIIARGGGSLEDLWCFNDESLIRAAFACDIPIISAIGHETDYSLLDYVADYRAPTPTQAGEKIVPIRNDLRFTIQQYGQRLQRILPEYIKNQSKTLTLIAKNMGTPQDYLNQYQQKLDDYHHDLQQCWRYKLEKCQIPSISLSSLHQQIKKHQQYIGQIALRCHDYVKYNMHHKQQSLNQQSALLNNLSHIATLNRGYAIAKQNNGALITNASDAIKTHHYILQFHDGDVKIKNDMPPKQEELFK